MRVWIIISFIEVIKTFLLLFKQAVTCHAYSVYRLYTYCEHGSCFHSSLINQSLVKLWCGFSLASWWICFGWEGAVLLSVNLLQFCNFMQSDLVILVTVDTLGFWLVQSNERRWFYCKHSAAGGTSPKLSGSFFRVVWKRLEICSSEQYYNTITC